MTEPLLPVPKSLEPYLNNEPVLTGKLLPVVSAENYQAAADASGGIGSTGIILGGVPTTIGATMLGYIALHPELHNMLNPTPGYFMFAVGLAVVSAGIVYTRKFVRSQRWLRSASAVRLQTWLKQYWYLETAFNGKQAYEIEKFFLQGDKGRFTFHDVNGQRFTVIGGDAPYKLLDHMNNPLTSRAMDEAEKIAPVQLRPPVPAARKAAKTEISDTQAFAMLNAVGRAAFQNADLLHAKLAAVSDLSVEDQHVVNRAAEIISDCKILTGRLANGSAAGQQTGLDNIVATLADVMSMLREVQFRIDRDAVRDSQVLARYAASFTKPTAGKLEV